MDNHRKTHNAYLAFTMWQNKERSTSTGKPNSTTETINSFTNSPGSHDNGGLIKTLKAASTPQLLKEKSAFVLCLTSLVLLTTCLGS